MFHQFRRPPRPRSTHPRRRIFRHSKFPLPHRQCSCRRRLYRLRRHRCRSCRPRRSYPPPHRLRSNFCRCYPSFRHCRLAPVRSRTRRLRTRRAAVQRSRPKRISRVLQLGSVARARWPKKNPSRLDSWFARASLRPRPCPDRNGTATTASPGGLTKNFR